MRSEADNKKWGTIYLGGTKEATLESLDAMQAAARQDQWNQRTQNDYLDRVRERATDRAREILGAAHTERLAILAEAQTDAERIRLETQVQYDKADTALADAEAIRTEAQAVRDDAEAIRNAAKEDGFNTGLANARDELDAFRRAMGASIAMVLQSIERQNGAIFSAWREEVVALVQTCVNKGTEWVLQDQHNAVLRALVMESVRQLDNRHTVTLRVHPDDEAAVADMFAAAREAMPDVDRWIVQGDASVELGGLIAESPSSTVDNRLALRTELVEGILQHLTLPEGEAEVIAAQAIHDVVREQVAHIESLAPPVPEQYLSDHADQENHAEQGTEHDSNPSDVSPTAPMADASSQEHSHADLAAAPLHDADMPDMPAMPDEMDGPDGTDIPDLLAMTTDLLANEVPETPSDLAPESSAGHAQSPNTGHAPSEVLSPSEQPSYDDTVLPASPLPVQSAADVDNSPNATLETAAPESVASETTAPETTAPDSEHNTRVAAPSPQPAPPLPSDTATAAPQADSAPNSAAAPAQAAAPVQTSAPVQASAPVPPPPATAPLTAHSSSPVQAAPSLAELEEELLPLPEENSDAVNAVLAGGGFLSDDDSLGSRS